MLLSYVWQNYQLEYWQALHFCVSEQARHACVHDSQQIIAAPPLQLFYSTGTKAPILSLWDSCTNVIAQLLLHCSCCTDTIRLSTCTLPASAQSHISTQSLCPANEVLGQISKRLPRHQWPNLSRHASFLVALMLNAVATVLFIN